MTRFKELARIERAIHENDAAQLKWALSYCRIRISIAATKSQGKYWSQLLAKVESKFSPSDETS